MRHLKIARALNHAQLQWIGYAFKSSGTGEPEQIKKWLKSHQILKTDGHIWVTSTGFVVMAIHANLAKCIGEFIVVPGVDDGGRRGFLVLREAAVPFHSLASCPFAAMEEAMACSDRADRLVTAYGSTDRLQRSVAKAPWYLRILATDAQQSGLSPWETEALLKGKGLFRIARRFGIPRLFVKTSDPYGARLTASALLRVE